MRPLVVLALLAQTASAQTTRYPRPFVAPKPPVRAPQPAPPAPAPMRPSIGLDDVLSIDGLRGPIREEQEEILKSLIVNTPDSEAEEKADYYFRLGELYAKQQRVWRLRAADAELRHAPDRQAYAMKAKEYLLQAVKTFKLLTDGDAFRAYPRLDVALFDYAYTLESGRYMQEARAVFDKLLRNYPTSKYVPEAYVAFADYYFETNQVTDAEMFYRKVLEAPASAMTPYARYKLAWILLAAKRDRDAVEMFVTVARMAPAPSQQAIVAAAKRDLARTASATVRPETAYAMFEQIDPTSVLDMVEALAGAYRDDGRVTDAIAAYRELIKHAQTSSPLCRWQLELARLVVATTPRAAVADVERAARIVDAPAECHDPAIAMARDLAFVEHAEWAATRDPDALAHAEALYRAYLDASPGDHGEVAYYFAELLWSHADVEPDARQRSSRWQRAAEAFHAAESTDPHRRRDIARAAFLAWKNALDLDPRPEIAAGPIDLVAASRRKLTVRAMPARDQAIVDACTSFIDAAVVGEPELASAKLVEALLYRRSDHADQAIAVLEDLVSHHKADDTAEVSANLLLEQLVHTRRFDDALLVVDRMAADTAFVAGKPTLQRNIELLRSRSLR